MKTFDIVKHILSTADDTSMIYRGNKDITPEEMVGITEKHYSGNGSIIEFDTLDDFARIHNIVVFSASGEYLGTRSDCWFNDIDRDWYDKDLPVRV